MRFGNKLNKWLPRKCIDMKDQAGHC